MIVIFAFLGVACTEDCGDGVDNDIDGLTDCEDDDCLGELGCIHPAGVEVTITGGSMALELRDSARRDTTFWRRNETDTVNATGVTGLVRVMPSSLDSWSSAAATTCAWGVSSVEGKMTESSTGGSDIETCYRPTRVGFWIDSGCRISSSWFLPSGLKARGPNVNVCRQVSFVTTFTYGRWYTGDIFHSSTSSSTFSSLYWARQVSTHRMSVSMEQTTHMVYL